ATQVPEYTHDFLRFASLSEGRKGHVRKWEWRDVDRSDGMIVSRAENVKNNRPHKIVLEGELAAIIERRWAAREYNTADGGVGISPYVFHRDGLPVGDFRKAWASVRVPGCGISGKTLSRPAAIRSEEHGPRRRPRRPGDGDFGSPYPYDS